MTDSPLFSPDANFSPVSRRWLMIGVWSLAIAGIFSLILVISRTPSFCGIELLTKLFHEALVVHVDLSVLVWFVSIACMFWSLLSESSPPVIPFVRRSAQLCFILGMTFIALSPLDPKAAGVMSNYIPVITSPVFFIGLSLLLCGSLLMLFHLFTSKKMSRAFAPPIRFAILSSGLIAVFSIAAYVWSFHLLPSQIDGQQYYEMGFWGGGHVLQFVHIQLIMVCWLWLATALKPGFSISHKMLYGLFAVGLLVALATPIAYLRFDITSSEFRHFFTSGMIMAGGIAPTILSLFIIPVLWQKRAERKGGQRAIWSVLFMSLLLFIYGGLLGGLIQDQNVVIPAHYHGSIVGVTLAFMGISYLLLPRFGYKNVAGWKLAYWQPIIYGVGQIIHISGLAYSGGYGAVQRKTPCGEMLPLAGDIKAAMGFMGLGGVLAIIGGLMFVVVVWRAVRRH